MRQIWFWLVEQKVCLSFLTLFEARALVAAMGGRITVDSRPGQGATFTIHVPAAEAPAQLIRKRA